MNGDVVLVSPRGMTTAMAQTVAQGCRSAGVKTVLWQQQGDGGWPTVPPPVLAVGYLKVGERRVSDELAAADKMFPGLPILLLCEESLTRGVVRLNDGRVTLLGPPFTANSIADAVRHASSPSGIAPGQCFSRRFTRVSRGPTWWAAAVTHYDTPRDLSDGCPAFPWVASPDAEDSYAAVLPTRPNDHLPAVRYRELIEAVRSGNADSIAGAAGAELGSAAVVAVGGTPREVKLSLPPEGVTAWVFSPYRLPQRWPITHGVVSVSFAPGDIVAVLSSASGSPTVSPEQLWSPAHGGSELLRRILQELRQVDRSTAVVLVEEW